MRQGQSVGPFQWGAFFVRQHSPNLRAAQIHTDYESAHPVLLGSFQVADNDMSHHYKNASQQILQVYCCGMDTTK
jgi:hypothetical protein